MKRHGYITAEEEKIANAIPVESLTSDNNATSNNPYQGYIDTVADEVEENFGVNPYDTPLLIYTNLDRSKQDAVNSVLNGENYNWINDKIQTGVAVLDSQTGGILAIGNGRNRDGARQLNNATAISRQPGSSAKPLFDYGPGIEYNNWSTYQLFDDSKYTYSNGRSIKNWDNGYFGTITLRRALSTSRNIPALKAFQQVDNDKIKEFVLNLGMDPELCTTPGYSYDKETDKCIKKEGKKIVDTKSPEKLHEAHSIGSFTGTNPLQMAGAYAAFSNGGTYHEPHAVNKVVFRQTGKTEERKIKSNEAMSDATAFMISSVLQDVALTGGTPKNVACKTGTTNFDENYMNQLNMPGDAIRDSWVVGYSTKTVIGMWYGYNKITDSKHCLRNIPATIAKDKLFKALAEGAFESNKEEFKMPDSVVKLPIILGSNPPRVAPSGYGGSVVYELFKKGYEPDNSSSNSEDSERLPKPENLKGTYSNGKVTLTWSGVSASSNDNYGELGYNVYLGNTLLGFTTSTSYTYETKSTTNLSFKVVATYKSYSGLSSEASTTTVKIENDNNHQEEKPNPPTTNTITYKIEYYCGETLLSSKTQSASSQSTSIKINASLIPDITPPESSGCSPSRDTEKTGSDFIISNNSNPIKIYYHEINNQQP